MKYLNRNWLRRLTAFMLALAVVLSLPVVSPTAAEETAQEPVEAAEKIYSANFEGAVIGRGVKDWEFFAADSRGQYDPESNWTENYTLKVAGDSNDGTRSMGVAAKNGTRGYVTASSPYIDVTGSTGYALEYAMKIENAGERAGFFGGKFFVDEYDADKKLIQRVLYGGEKRENMDWTVFAAYLQTLENTAYIRLSFYLGGTWGQNIGVRMLIDSVYVEKITNDTLVDGGFEVGGSLDSVYSWHLSSKTIHNEDETHDWANNYILARRADGVSGNCVTVTRKGVGYVTLDSNMIRAEGNTTYVLDYSLRTENTVYETFYGVRAYIAQFDAEGKFLQSGQLHSEIRQEQDWTDLSYSTVTHADTAYIQVQFWCGGVSDSAFTASFDNVSLTVISRTLSENGVNNGGFEEKLGDTLFDWETPSRNDTKWYATANGYNGTNGIMCVKTGEDGHGYGVMKSNEFNVVPGLDYKLSYMARLANQNGNVYIVANIVVYDKDGEVIDRLRSSEFDARTKSDEWLQWMGYYTMPAGAVTARVEFLTCGTSYQCWIDDVTWHLRDDAATIWGFDAKDKNGNIAGWTVSDPASAGADTDIYYNGEQSLHIKHTTKNAAYTVTADTLIPVEKETRYQFNIYLKSQYSDIAGSGVRLNMITYDKDGERLSTIQGIHTSLSGGDESDWRELVCGVSSGLDVAYVRPQITVAAGVMDFWLDGMTWKLYDGNPYIEDFEDVTSDGKPAGWGSYILAGEPEFVADQSVVTIRAKSGDEGYVSGMWKVAKEYLDCTLKVEYQTTDSATAWVRIRYKTAAYMYLSIFGMLGSVLTGFLGHLIYHEPLGWNKLLGMVVLLLAVVVMSKYNKTVTHVSARKILPLLILAAVSMMLSDFSQKIFVNEIGGSAAEYSFYTYGFATVLLLPAFLLAKGSLAAQGAPLLKGHHFLLCFVIAAALFMNSYSKTLAAEYFTAAQIYPVLQGANLIASALLAHILLKEKITYRCIYGMSIAFVGIMIMNL